MYLYSTVSNPDTELIWGTTTELGENLKNSLSYEKQETQYYNDFERLEKLKNKLDEFNQYIEDFYSKESPSKDEIETFSNNMETYNDLNDEYDDLKWELHDKSPYKYIIRY